MEPPAEYVDGLPNLCGQEWLTSEAITRAGDARCPVGVPFAGGLNECILVKVVSAGEAGRTCAR
jgi:hypothetical protein